MNKQFIKHTKAPETSTVRIFGDHYSKRINYIDEIVQLAKDDFELIDEDIEVVLLSGQYNHMTAIQFVVATHNIPKDYFEWTRADDLGWPKHY